MKASTLAIVLAALMAISLAACNTNNTRTPPASPNTIGGDNGVVTSLPSGVPNTAGTAGAEQSRPVVIDDETSGYRGTSGPDTEMAARSSEFSDENVSIDLAFDREGYTVNELIGLTATITNNSERPIAFLKGSGNNQVPEALRINLGNFTSTYVPPQATADYQIEHLQPGQSVTYSLPHAPYTHAGENMAAGIGFEKTIDFFQSDEFTPARAGEITGELTFSYIINDTGAAEAPLNFEGENVKTLTGQFTTNIVD